MCFACDFDCCSVLMCFASEPYSYIFWEVEGNPELLARMATCKKVNACPDGGYKKLQLKILGNREIKCKICKLLMDDYKFSQEDCERAQLGELDDIADQVLVDVNQENQQEEKKGEINGNQQHQQEEKKGEIHRNRRRQQEDEDESSDDNNNRYTRVEAAMYLKSFEPMFTLLPAGSFGKKVPVRCNICKSKSWPNGKVLEMGKLRPYMVKHFVKQHMQSSTHFRHAKKLEEPVITVDKAPCQGLNIEDEENANMLYTYRAEFELWATYSNFADCAKHEYTREKNNGPWTARSYHCLGMCHMRPNVERQVCPKCLELGDRHGAPCLYLMVTIF